MKSRDSIDYCEHDENEAVCIKCLLTRAREYNSQLRAEAISCKDSLVEQSRHISELCIENQQLRTALDNLTEVARLAQEAAATAETRAVTGCADLAKLWDDGIVGTIIAEAIKKEYGLE